MHKAYCVKDKWHDCATVIFAESAGKAKSIALSTECCCDSDFINLEVYRLPHIDKYYKSGKVEMDWYNPEDRIALVTEAGFHCHYIELPECKQCPAREYCEDWQEYLEENDD